MATDAESFMDAADDLVRQLEKSKEVSKKELEAVRKELVADLKAEAKAAIQSMQTTQLGAAKVLIPNSDAMRKINITSQRMRKRLSSFRLSYLSPSQVNTLKSDGRELNDDPKKFIRHSRRLARHAREFLTQIGELEPTLQEEVDSTLAMIADNDMDLLKLEVKSMTRLTETLIRGVNGRKRQSQVVKEIDDWDMNRGLWNLSLLEHPDATVRSMLANASERMAERVTETVTEIPKRSHVFVGLGPAAESELTPGSRTAEFAFRVFDQNALDAKFRKLPEKQGSPSSWRDLGVGYNTKEWYVPIPPEVVEGITALAATRRSALLAAVEARAQEKAIEQTAAQELIRAKTSDTVWEELDAAFGDTIAAGGLTLTDTELVGPRKKIESLAKEVVDNYDGTPVDEGGLDLPKRTQAILRRWGQRILEGKGFKPS